jgi:hypothetical protein
VLYLSTTNGCGAEGSFTSNFIPAYPFKSACDVHDICHSGSSLKGVFDTAFKNDMFAITYSITGEKAKNSMLLQNLNKALFEEMAGVYHVAVKDSETARQAYCENTTADAIVCDPDWGTEDFDMSDLYYDGSWNYVNPNPPNNNGGGAGSGSHVICEV